MSTLLIVDDDQATLFLLKSKLSGQHAVTTATNGLEALACLEEETPDVVISDVMMPKMDGEEFHRVLRDDAQYRNIPFIFLTAKAERLEQNDRLFSAADHFVTKPFNFADLVAKVDHLLQVATGA